MLRTFELGGPFTGAKRELVFTVVRRIASAVITLTGSLLWLIGTYLASFVVLGESRRFVVFVVGAIVAGFGAAILWSGRAVNRAAAVYLLLIWIFLGVLSIVLIMIYGSQNLVEHLELVFVCIAFTTAAIDDECANAAPGIFRLGKGHTSFV